MRLFIVAGERSGDYLGAKLIAALRRRDPTLQIAGVGGEAMASEGLHSLFPLEDFAVMGFGAVLARLPRLLARIEQTARAALRFEPDVLVIVDSPDFTHRVARRVRRAAAHLPIIDYVSPSVWAWRPGRAPRMRGYVTEVLALLPFEPDVLQRLGGPPCTFVGHPLVEQLDELRPAPDELRARMTDPPTLLVMPGSRRSEIDRLMPVFGETLARLAAAGASMRAVLPAVPHLETEIRANVAGWPVRPDVIVGERPKLAAMQRARAALVASGTATLELALAGVPMVVAYKVSPLESLARHWIRVPSIVLPNLIVGRSVAPELLQEDCTPDGLAAALLPLLQRTDAGASQTAGFRGLAELLSRTDGLAPSEAAAKAVLSAARRGQ